MMQAVVHKLSFMFDRARQSLVFRGELADGFAFEVAFPIGHVALTFDAEAKGLGYIGEPMMGEYVTVDGFLGAVEIMHQRETGMSLGDVEMTSLGDVELGWFGSKLAKSVSHAVSSAAKSVAKPVAKGVVSVAKLSVKPVSIAAKAYVSTVKKVGQQALKYARKGAEQVGKAGLVVARSKLVGTALAGVAVAFPAVGAPALAAWGAANRAVAAMDAARAGVKTAVQVVNTVSRNAKALSGSPAPAARMALAGLRSVPAFR